MEKNAKLIEFQQSLAVLLEKTLKEASILHELTPS